jgi:hypothetical protein
MDLEVVLDRLSQNALAVAIHFGDREGLPPRNPSFLNRPSRAPGGHLAAQVAQDVESLAAITCLLSGLNPPRGTPERLLALGRPALLLQRTLLERRIARNKSALKDVQWPTAKRVDGPHLARLPGLRLQCRQGKVERGPRLLRLELTDRDWRDLSGWRKEARRVPTIVRAIYLLRGDGRLVAYAHPEHRVAFAAVTARHRPAV